MSLFLRVVANRMIRFTGNIFKTLAYPFHWVFPERRFIIPEFSPAAVKLLMMKGEQTIPRVIWQTNFTNKVTLPVYLNYVCNRWLSRHCDYYYVSTQAREQFLREYASEAVYRAYCRLTDGAAQADLWRLVVLFVRGGVYMDIDATLVWSLHQLLGDETELFIKIKKNTEITNYFIASAPGNARLAATIDQVVYNIDHYDPVMGVYNTTGPLALNKVLADDPLVCTADRKYVCIQGAFTNEYFQYWDKPGGKWIHSDPAKLVKK